jgi:6-phosphogluconolactonase (cycloisomerase 2 family)
MWRAILCPRGVMRAVLVVGLAAGLAIGPGWSQEKETPATLAARIDRLIRELDDDQFNVRERADAELRAIGQPAIEKLKAATGDPSSERKQRAARILESVRLAGLNLRHVYTETRPELNGAISAAVSGDGKFLYVPSYRTHTLNVFRCDSHKGSLELIQSIADRERMQGAICLRLSPSGKLAVSSSIFSKTVVLTTRDPASGRLEVADVMRNDPGAGITLQWPTDAAFSPDSRFIYVIDDRDAAVVVLRVTDEPKLQFVESFTAVERCLAGARGIAMHPRGEAIFVVSTTGHLTALARDAASGKLATAQVVKDEQDGVRGLAGVYGVCSSPDGRFVYTCAGKEGGDQSIAAYGWDGKRLSVLQEFIAEESDLKGYRIANEIVVTPDGTRLFASGTGSGSLACFDRDPATGRLTFRACLRSDATGAGLEKGAVGLACSPSGNFLYVTLEDGNAVTVFDGAVAKE